MGHKIQFQRGFQDNTSEILGSLESDLKFWDPLFESRLGTRIGIEIQAWVVSESQSRNQNSDNQSLGNRNGDLVKADFLLNFNPFFFQNMLFSFFR